MVRNFLFFIFIFINSIFLLFYKKNEVHSSAELVIKPGSKLNQISEILYDNNLIKNKLVFIFWVKINFSEKKLKFGEYFFSGNFSVNSILEKLLEGKSVNKKITIIEGSSKNELLYSLNKIDLNKKLSLKSIPNQIIADTYFYESFDSPENVLNNLVLKSNKSALEIWENRDKSIPLKNISEMFILASIVEKETAIKNEKPLISGVFYNRLKKNMRLQSDPTVVYAITLGERKMERKLLRKDLKFKSKFNTYTNNGLPPSPISIPGLDSLKSVANPYQSDFLYFVSNQKDGHHIFSVSYEEHLENIKLVKESKTNNE